MQFTCTMLSSVARPAPQIFPHYLIKGKFPERNKKKTHKIYFEFLYKFSLKHFSLYEVLSEVKRILVFT